jgi:hypothetical protein
MAKGLSDSMRELGRQIRRLASEESDGTSAGRVNVSGRVNRAVVANVGGSGASQASSSSQRVRIRQDPGGTVEHVETVERTFRQGHGGSGDQPDAHQER